MPKTYTIVAIETNEQEPRHACALDCPGRTKHCPVVPLRSDKCEVGTQLLYELLNALNCVEDEFMDKSDWEPMVNDARAKLRQLLYPRLIPESPESNG
jgi:hypothetical protein